LPFAEAMQRLDAARAGNRVPLIAVIHSPTDHV
jgi:hypothetical protein